MSFWCQNFFQKTNKKNSRISALASKMRLEAEILEKISLVFWKKFWHQKDILKLIDLYAPRYIFSKFKYVSNIAKVYIEVIL